METPWDLHQLEVILEDRKSWQLVIAGPGAGKSAVACQRVAYLVDEGVNPTKILIISFTRAAVSEIRSRISSYRVSSGDTSQVRISTIDAHAWSLRVPFDDQDISDDFSGKSFELSVERVVTLLQEKNDDLIEFLSALEHVIVDEAQDVFGARAELVNELLKSLSAEAGVTILADPVQEIYRFTTDGDESAKYAKSLLQLVKENPPRTLIEKELKEIHRIKKEDLRELFIRSRREVEKPANPIESLSRVRAAIKETSGTDVGEATNESIAEVLKKAGNEPMLVLFRRRADALIASSYCSSANVEHRLRLSGAGIVTKPWIGWLFQETPLSIVAKPEFDKLWQTQFDRASGAFANEKKEDCWSVLKTLCAYRRPDTIDLVHLRTLVTRAKPPIELCYPDLGTTGPILGTIHASKGREADYVLLVFPADKRDDKEATEEEVLEESRVYYVGATRARSFLAVAALSAPRVGYLTSKRIFRRVSDNAAQLELGREGDVDKVAHLNWKKALEVQLILAGMNGACPGSISTADEREKYQKRVVLQRKIGDVTKIIEVGVMSESFDIDLSRLWKMVEGGTQKLRPAPSIPHVSVLGATTVGLTEAQRLSLPAPFNQSGFALAPVIKGFPKVNFLFRKFSQ